MAAALAWLAVLARACELTPGTAAPVDGYLFGVNAVNGPVVNLTYSDAALLAAVRALRPGAVRSPPSQKGQRALPLQWFATCAVTTVELAHKVGISLQRDVS